VAGCWNDYCVIGQVSSNTTDPGRRWCWRCLRIGQANVKGECDIICGVWGCAPMICERSCTSAQLTSAVPKPGQTIGESYSRPRIESAEERGPHWCSSVFGCRNACGVVDQIDIVEVDDIIRRTAVRDNTHTPRLRASLCYFRVFISPQLRLQRH